MMAGLWYSANWGLVLAGLIAGVAALVFSRRLSLLWHGASMSAIGLYLGICVIIFMETLPLGRGLVVAGLQLAVGLGILGASLCRLHLVGVAIYAAGGVGPGSAIRGAVHCRRGIPDDTGALCRYRVAPLRIDAEPRPGETRWQKSAAGAGKHRHIEKARRNDIRRAF